MSDPQNIDEVILAIQANPPKIVKSKSGQVGQQKTRYADLVEVAAAVMPILTSMQTIWKCRPTRLLDHEGYPFVLAYELKHLPSGTSEIGYFPLKLDENSQKVGSAVTYARRYALVGVLGLVPEDEDDDGTATNGQRTAQRAAPAAARRPRQTAPESAPEPGAPPTAQRASRPAGPALPNEAATSEPIRGRGGLITEPMARKLAITMRQALGEDSGTRKQYIVDMVGREVASSKDLTFDEGRGLIDAFEKANQDADTAAATVIDIYRRTTGGSRSGAVESDVAPELIAAIRAGQWKTVQSYADDPGGYGPNIDAAKGALAGAGAQKPVTRQPGQRSRNAAEAIGTGDMGNEQAPWEDGGLPV